MLSSGRINYHTRSGFTLMEVLAGLAIISIVSSIVLPGIANFSSGLQVQAEAETFVQSVRMARYKAISDQAVYRLIFDTDPSTTAPSAYRVQVHLAFDEFSATAFNSSTFDMHNYYSLNWADVLDSEEIMLDTSMTIVTDLPQDIYFWPNGQIYLTPDTSVAATTIAERYIGFSYGSSGIKVLLTPMGIFSSEAYAADEVDITDDTEVIW